MGVSYACPYFFWHDNNSGTFSHNTPVFGSAILLPEDSMMHLDDEYKPPVKQWVIIQELNEAYMLGVLTCRMVGINTPGWPGMSNASSGWCSEDILVEYPGGKLYFC